MYGFYKMVLFFLNVRIVGIFSKIVLIVRIFKKMYGFFSKKMYGLYCVFFRKFYGLYGFFSKIVEIVRIFSVIGAFSKIKNFFEMGIWLITLIKFLFFFNVISEKN